MEKVDFLRKKYPRFIYENYFWKISNKNLEISFDFRIEPNIFFQPKIVINNVDGPRIKRVGEGTLNNLIFNLGLMEIPSYWKATCSPEIEIKAGPLSMKASPSSPSSTNLRFVSMNQEQIKYPSVVKGGDERKFIDWWKDLIINGMGQFFYENKIDWRSKNFLTIECNNGNKYKNFNGKLKNRYLVPFAGGRDSIATLENLKKKGEMALFLVNPNKQIKKVVKVTGVKKQIIVKRIVDKKLLELNKKGYLNGHTPFTAVLSFLSVFSAILFNYKNIVFSNEKSANEGNVKYLGKIINHQWAKSSEFERMFKNYCKKYLAKNVNYFSYLRKYGELEISKMLTKYPKYFPVFSSCNASMRIGAKQIRWCGNCPKCLFVYMTLFPFLEKKELLKIFGKDIFQNKRLLPTMKALLRQGSPKPFECVGTKKESLIAFYLSWKKSRDPVSAELPFLLRYFERNILPKYPNLEKESKKIIDSWNSQNDLPKEFGKVLKKMVFKK